MTIKGSADLDVRIAHMWEQQTARIAREKEASKKRGQEHAKRTRRQIDFEIRLDGIKKRWAEIRRKEEAIIAADTMVAMRIYRGPVLGGKGKMPLDVATRWLRLRTEGDGPELEPYASYFRQIAGEHRKEIRFVAIPGINAYALGGGVVEIWPIRTQYGFAVALHELAHLLRPCDASTHRRVPRKSGVGTLCARCELRAWECAALELAPTWTLYMHDALQENLPTYRPFGTGVEQSEIDYMCAWEWPDTIQRSRRRRIA
jgi:hypothetical protein